MSLENFTFQSIDTNNEVPIGSADFCIGTPLPGSCSLEEQLRNEQNPILEDPDGPAGRSVFAPTSSFDRTWAQMTYGTDLPPAMSVVDSITVQAPSLRHALKSQEVEAFVRALAVENTWEGFARGFRYTA